MTHSNQTSGVEQSAAQVQHNRPIKGVLEFPLPRDVLSDVSRRTRVRVPRDWARDWARVEIATLTHEKGANEW